MAFSIANANINKSIIDDVKIEDRNTLEKFRQLMNFTQEQDKELRKKIDQTMSTKKGDIVDFKSSMFSISSSDLPDNSTLKAIDIDVINLRISLLFKLSKVFSLAIKYVDSADRQIEGTLSHKHFSIKGYILDSVINRIVDKELE